MRCASSAFLIGLAFLTYSQDSTTQKTTSYTQDGIHYVISPPINGEGQGFICNVVSMSFCELKVSLQTGEVLLDTMIGDRHYTSKSTVSDSLVRLVLTYPCGVNSAVGYGNYLFIREYHYDYDTIPTISGTQIYIRAEIEVICKSNLIVLHSVCKSPPTAIRLSTKPIFNNVTSNRIYSVNGRICKFNGKLAIYHSLIGVKM